MSALTRASWPIHEMPLRLDFSLEKPFILSEFLKTSLPRKLDIVGDDGGYLVLVLDDLSDLVIFIRCSIQ